MAASRPWRFWKVNYISTAWYAWIKICKNCIVMGYHGDAIGYTRYTWVFKDVGYDILEFLKMKRTTELTSCVFLIYPRNIGNPARNLKIFKVVYGFYCSYKSTNISLGTLLEPSEPAELPMIFWRPGQSCLLNWWPWGLSIWMHYSNMIWILLTSCLLWGEEMGKHLMAH